MATQSFGTLALWLLIALVLFATFAAITRRLAGRSRLEYPGTKDLGDADRTDIGPDPSLRRLAEDEVARMRLSGKIDQKKTG